MTFFNTTAAFTGAQKVLAQWLWQLLSLAGTRAMSSVTQEITWPRGGGKLVHNLVSKLDPDAEHVISPDSVKTALEAETDL